MKQLVLLIFAASMLGASSPADNVKELPIGTFSGETASYCYTSQHLGMIMTYFVNSGKTFSDASLNHSSNEGFYIEGTTKDKDRYEMTRIALKVDGNKLYISNTSTIYFCESEVNGDCILTVTKQDNRTTYSPKSKSGKRVSPGIYGREKEYLPSTLVNYLNGLNIEGCN